MQTGAGTVTLQELCDAVLGSSVAAEAFSDTGVTGGGPSTQDPLGASGAGGIDTQQCVRGRTLGDLDLSGCLLYGETTRGMRMHGHGDHSGWHIVFLYERESHS